MLDPTLAEVIGQIHAAPPRLVLAFAGAGSAGLHWLHAVAGSSRTMLEAVDCYAPRSLAALVGYPPAQAVSGETARALAEWALGRAVALAEGDWPLLGVGCTAAISTDRARRGMNRAAVALLRRDGPPALYELRLARDLRDRAAQEDLVSRLIVRAIARACAIRADLALALSPGDLLSEEN